MLIILLRSLLLVAAFAEGQTVSRNGLDNRRWLLPSSSSDLETSGMHETLFPTMQRLQPPPFTFMAFPSGGKTESGLDLEFITKNAAIETNRQRALAAVGGISQFADGSLNPELTAGMSRQQLIPNTAPREFGATPREFPTFSGSSRFMPSQFAPVGFPRRTDFPSSVDPFRTPLIARPGMLPMSLGGLPEFVPQRADRFFSRNSFERTRKPEDSVGLDTDPSSAVTDNNNNHFEKFTRNESDQHHRYPGPHPLLNNNNYHYYGSDFYGAMLRAPFNYYYNNRWWWPPPPPPPAAGVASGLTGTGGLETRSPTFRPLNASHSRLLPSAAPPPFRQSDFVLGTERTLKRLNAAPNLTSNDVANK